MSQRKGKSRTSWELGASIINTQNTEDPMSDYERVSLTKRHPSRTFRDAGMGGTNTRIGQCQRDTKFRSLEVGAGLTAA